MLSLLGLKQTGNSSNDITPHPGVPYTVHPTQMMSLLFCQAPLPLSHSPGKTCVIAGGYNR